MTESPDPPKLPVELEAKVGKVVQGLSKEKAQAVRRVVTTIAQHHRGPLPPPEQLLAYDEIIKDGAERIMRVMEKEQEHRHTCEGSLVQSSIQLANRGQVIATVLTLILIGVATYLAINGHDWLAGTITTTTIAAITAAFLVGRSPEREAEADDDDPPKTKKKKR